MPARTPAAAASCPVYSPRRHCSPGRVKSGGASFVSTIPTPFPGGMPAASGHHVLRSAAVAARGEKSGFWAENANPHGCAPMPWRP